MRCSHPISGWKVDMKKADREAELQQLWCQRPADQRTAVDVLAFYTWVQQNRA